MQVKITDEQEKYECLGCYKAKTSYAIEIMHRNGGGYKVHLCPDCIKQLSEELASEIRRKIQ